MQTVEWLWKTGLLLFHIRTYIHNSKHKSQKRLCEVQRDKESKGISKNKIKLILFLFFFVYAYKRFCRFATVTVNQKIYNEINNISFADTTIKVNYFFWYVYISFSQLNLECTRAILTKLLLCAIAFRMIIDFINKRFSRILSYKCLEYIILLFSAAYTIFCRCPIYFI